jgi:chloride channel 3/4/5
MRKNLSTLTDTGMRAKDIGKLELQLRLRSIGFMTSLLSSTQLDSLLSSTDVKGFPIVTSDGALTLVGYIDRSEIRHVLGELVFPIKINY